MGINNGYDKNLLLKGIPVCSIILAIRGALLLFFLNVAYGGGSGLKLLMLERCPVKSKHNLQGPYLD